MSDEGEKTCPLCAEEMDMTDQQLKPCKCGYDICVWCWHHIMDMAEKEQTEGRCPACRTPYNKEKIVGTTASCGRVVSEMNVEKKLKSSKAKNKSLESRKHLASVRVIQRNLVYVVGLPLSFADEDLLQRRDYFGQYGKVSKVSISRTASGAIQHFANSTCSVYITYSKEEEAVRCIQSVHGFILDGKPLRACFGTTKYCHAWLRNVSCSNPDCLYLHEIGSQEDSFTKDEIISAYTRVQHITGSSNSTQRHSGNLLPPPADEYCNNTSASPGKPITKPAVNTNHNTSMGARVSPPNSSSGGSAALPAGASWGARASNNHPLHTSTNCSNGPLKKADTGNVPVACSEAVSQNQLSSCHSDSGTTLARSKESTDPQNKTETEAFKSVGKESSADGRIPFSESSFAPVHSDNLPVNRKPQGSPATMLPPNGTNIVESSVISSGLASEKASIDATDGNLEYMCSDILSMGIHDNNIFENDYGQHVREAVTQISGTTADTSEEVGFRVAQSDFRLGLPKVTKIDVHDREHDMLPFTNQRLKDPEVAANRTLDFSDASYLTRHTDINSPEYSKADASICLDRLVIDKNSNIPSGYSEYIPKSSEVYDVECSDLFPSKEKRSLLGRYESEPGSNAVDMGESSIISNILSIDFDPWDESLTSPQNLAKLLGDNDKEGSFSVPGSRRIQNSNQSRFSFAREEESKSRFSGFGQSVDYFAKGSSQHPFGHESSNSNNLHIEKFDGRNGFPILNGMESEIFTGSHSHISSNRNSVSRSKVSAPPGFLAPNRPPPPGFPSHDRTDHFLDIVSGNHLPDASSLLRHIQAPSSANTISNGDIEFMDPAILAVGKGTLPCRINSIGIDFSSGYSSQYEDARFQSFVQRSLPSHQNQRYTDLGESFSPLGDAYRVPSRVMEQALSNNISPFSQYTLSQSRNGMISNGQWDSWNEVQAGNNLGMAELLQTERLGFNKFYGSHEDPMIRMPSSGNLYNDYGI